MQSRPDEMLRWAVIYLKHSCPAISLACSEILRYWTFKSNATPTILPGGLRLSYGPSLLSVDNMIGENHYWPPFKTQHYSKKSTSRICCFCCDWYDIGLQYEAVSDYHIKCFKSHIDPTKCGRTVQSRIFCIFPGRVYPIKHSWSATLYTLAHAHILLCFVSLWSYYQLYMYSCGRNYSSKKIRTPLSCLVNTVVVDCLVIQGRHISLQLMVLMPDTENIMFQRREWYVTFNPSRTSAISLRALLLTETNWYCGKDT